MTNLFPALALSAAILTGCAPAHSTNDFKYEGEFDGKNVTYIEVRFQSNPAKHKNWMRVRDNETYYEFEDNLLFHSIFQKGYTNDFLENVMTNLRRTYPPVQMTPIEKGASDVVRSNATRMYNDFRQRIKLIQEIQKGKAEEERK
jgi:hypothetical protein